MNKGGNKGIGNPASTYRTGDVVFRKSTLGSPGAGWIKSGDTVNASNVNKIGKLNTAMQIWATQNALVPANQSPSTGYGTVNSVAYGNGLWVAVGYYFDGTFYAPYLSYSTDTLTWTTQTAPPFPQSGDSALISISFNNNLWTMGADAGLFSGYPNQGTWTTSTTYTTNQAVTYSGYTWYTPNGSNLGNQPDLLNWITQTSQFVTQINSVAYGNGLWVAGGFGGALRTSTDAITWVTRTSQFGGSSTIYSVAYGNGLWVAGGVNGTLRTSTDAINWVTRVSQFGTTGIYSVAYGNGLWVAAGGLLTGILRTSTDAINWVTRTSQFGSNSIQSVAYGNGLWVAGGNAGILRTSTDAINWVTQNSQFGGQIIYSVAYGNGLWATGGDGGFLRTSTDAINWVTRTSQFFGTPIQSVAYGNGLWVAGGGSGGALRTSTDAINWVTQTSQFGTSGIQSVAYGNGLWVAGGLGGALRTSNFYWNYLNSTVITNSIAWATQNAVGYTNLDSVNYIAYGGGVWTAVGSSSNGSIKTSTDGVTWTTRNANAGTNLLYTVAYGNSTWVAGGSSGIIRTSTDAVTWTTRTSNFGSSNVNIVSYGNGVFVAGGAGGSLRTSIDGITWTTRTSTLTSIIRAAAYGAGFWFAGDDTGAVCVSTDAITWVTSMKLGQSNSSVTYSNGVWLMPQSNSTIARYGFPYVGMQIPTLSAPTGYSAWIKT